MSRTSFLARKLAAVGSFLLVFQGVLGTGYAQPLPSSRNAVAGYDCWVYLLVDAALTDGITTVADDYRDDTAFDEYDAYLTQYAGVSLDSSSATTDVWGLAGATDTGEVPGAWAYAGSNNEAIGIEYDALTMWIAHSHSESEFTIEANPNHSSVGTGTDSATLHAFLSFTAIGEFTGGTFDVELYAEVGDSNATMVPLDSTGDSWSVTGTLSQSTSANPSAAAVNLDDSVLQGVIDYPVTQATNVNGVIGCVGDVYLTNVQGWTNGNDYEAFTYAALGWYAVFVP
jgi:hypothetical protein